MAYKRGDKWVGFYRDAAGKQHTNGNFHRKRDADLWEQEQKSAIRNDTWVDPGRSRMTVGQWSETWMAGRVHLKPGRADRPARAPRAAAQRAHRRGRGGHRGRRRDGLWYAEDTSKIGRASCRERV